MGYYSGTVFHRVQPELFVQGGGLDRELRLRSTLPPVPNESSNGLRNTRGTRGSRAHGRPGLRALAVLRQSRRQHAARRRARARLHGVRARHGRHRGIRGDRPPADGRCGPVSRRSPDAARRDQVDRARSTRRRWPLCPPKGARPRCKAEIAAAAAAGNAADALRLIGHYRAICGADDPEIALTEARMALAAERSPPRAVRARRAPGDDGRRASRSCGGDGAVPRSGDRSTMTSQLVAGCAPAGRPGAARREQRQRGRDGRVAAASARVRGRRRDLSRLPLDASSTTRTRSAGLRNAAVEEHNRMVAAMEEIAAALQRADPHLQGARLSGARGGKIAA